MKKLLGLVMILFLMNCHRLDEGNPPWDTVFDLSRSKPHDMQSLQQDLGFQTVDMCNPNDFMSYTVDLKDNSDMKNTHKKDCDE